MRGAAPARPRRPWQRSGRDDPSLTPGRGNAIGGVGWAVEWRPRSVET